MSHPHTSPGGGPRDGPGGSVTTSPIPLQAKGRQKRVKAVADCKGDKARELTFSKGEVIVVTREEDEQSWVSVSRAWTGAGIPNLVPSPCPQLSSGGNGGSQGSWMGAPCPTCAWRRAWGARHGFVSRNLRPAMGMSAPKLLPCLRWDSHLP